MSIFTLLMILAIYIVRPGDWIPGMDLRWNLILNVAGGVALAALIINGKVGVSRDRTWAYLIAFFGLMIISSLIMGQADTIPLYSPQMATNILVYTLVCSAVQSPRQLNLVTNTFLALALFVVYQCHIQMTAGQNIAGVAPIVRSSVSVDLDGATVNAESFQALWVGIFGDPNDVGLLFIALLPLAMAKALFIPGQALTRAFSAFSSAALIYGVYLTDSRGTFVAFLGSVGFFFILKYRSIKGLIAAAIGGFLLITVGPSRMQSLTAADDSAMERVYAWIEALFAFSLYPFFGLGPRHWLDWHHKTTHNSFVLAFVENGFVAYVCWLAVIIIPLYLVTKAAFSAELSTERNKHAAYGACIAGVMLSIFFISRTYVLIPFFIAACVLTHCRVHARSSYIENLQDATPIRLAGVAAASIVMIWITNILTTRLML